MYSDSDKKAVLVRLSQFVFTKESEDLRKDLFDSLVEQVLLHHGEMSKIQIKESIEKVISSNVPVVLLEESLKRLVQKKSSPNKKHQGNQLLADTVSKRRNS